MEDDGLTCAKIKELFEAGLAPLHAQLQSVESSLRVLSSTPNLHSTPFGNGVSCEDSEREAIPRGILAMSPRPSFRSGPGAPSALRQLSEDTENVSNLPDESGSNLPEEAGYHSQGQDSKLSRQDSQSSHGDTGSHTGRPSPRNRQSCSHVIAGAIREDSAAELQQLMFLREMSSMGLVGQGTTAFKILHFRVRLVQWLAKMEQEPEREGCIAQAVQTRAFETFSMFLIFLNTCVVTYYTDYMMKHNEQDPGVVYYALNDVFTLVFLTEMLVRMWSHRLYYFTNRERHWNWLDFFLVGLSIFDSLLPKFVEDGGGGSMSFMRLVRLAKLAKILRALRAIKFFKELSVLVSTFRTSLMTVFWFLVLNTLLLFIFSLLLLHGMTDYIVTNNASLTEADKEEIHYWFGSVGRSMLTLVWGFTNGLDWGTIYNVVRPAGAFYSGAYFMFTISFLLVLLNILTGTLVEKALEASQPERHDLIMKERKKKHQEAIEFKRMVEMMDKDNNGEISWAEFAEMMTNEVFVTYMVSIGLDVTDVDLFFRTLLGDSEHDSVGLDDFVHGCMNMSGEASAVDVQKLLFVTARHQTELMRFHTESRDHFSRMDKNLDVLCSYALRGHLFEPAGAVGKAASAPAPSISEQLHL